MKKTFIRFITLLLSTCLLFTFTACDDTSDNDNVETGKYEYELLEDDDGDKYYEITNYTVSTDDLDDLDNVDSKYRNITIPKTGADFGETGTKASIPVKKIRASAFANKTILLSVVVGDNIESIGEGAFAGCTNLTEITLPYVGKSADATNNEKLFAYLFGTNEVANCTAVSSKPNAFEDGAGSDIVEDTATTYYLPNSLTKVTVTSGDIKDCAFYGVSTLTEVVFENATSIGKFAFYGATGLESVTISNKITHIYQSAFSGCTSLNEIIFEQNSTLEFIGKKAFYGCSKLGYTKLNTQIKPLVLPSSVNTILESAFENCSSLKGVDLSDTAISVIDIATFQGCTSLEFIALKNTLEIRYSAFANCDKLKKSGVIDNFTNKASIYTTLTNVQANAFDSDIED